MSNTKPYGIFSILKIAVVSIIVVITPIFLVFMAKNPPASKVRRTLVEATWAYESQTVKGEERAKALFQELMQNQHASPLMKDYALMQLMLINLRKILAPDFESARYAYNILSSKSDLKPRWKDILEEVRPLLEKNRLHLIE